MTMSAQIRSRFAIGATAAVLLAGVLAVGVGRLGPADAATPSQGTVSPGAPTVGWTGGPFVVPNTTGTALDAPDCSAPQSCDDFILHVTGLPAGYGTGHQLVITVGWPNTAADFDVYLLDSSDAIVATSASSADPEKIIVVPTAGDFTVRVVPFAPVGDSYTATASLVTTPSNPAPGTATPPVFANYPAPTTLKPKQDLMTEAGEPSIGNNFKTGATLYQSYLSTYKVTWNTATPVQATWSDVSADAAHGCAVGGLASLDPILFTDHATGRTFESQLSGQDSLTCYTDDDGQTWLPSQGGGPVSGADHQSIGGGSFAPGGGTLPTTSYPDSVYYCSQDIAAAICAVSLDGGTTFPQVAPTYNLMQCGGLHGHVKVAPDGTAYLPNKACGANAAAAISTNNGQSWEVHSIPGSTPGESDPSVGIGAGGTVYFGYVGADGKPAVATSTDKGQSWQYGQTVGTEFNIQTAVFPTLVAGDDDRAAFAYIGTATPGNSQDQVNFRGVWHLYVTTTYDGGKTWQTSDATPMDPVQRGTICTSGTTCGNDRNLLDFIDITMDKQGRVLVGYADGCVDACVTDASHNSDDGPADAQAAYPTIARQIAGRTLVAAQDQGVGTTRINLTAGKLTLVRRHGHLFGKMSVENTGTTTLHHVRVRLRYDHRKVRYTTIATLRPGAHRLVKTRWRVIDKRPRRQHVIAKVDPRNRILESDETDNVRRRNFKVL